MIIRDATEADFPAMIAVGREYYADSPNAAYAPLCEDSCADTLRLVLAQGILLVAEIEGAVVGFLAVIRAPSLINRAVIGASEVFFFVGQEARGHGAGAALLSAMVAACREQGFVFLQMHATSGSPGQLRSMYLDDGFVPTEYSFTRRL